MKIYIYILFFLLFLSGCSTSPVLEAVKTGKEGKTIPSISILLPDSLHYYNTKDIQAGKPTLVFYFSPGCPYCRLETRRIVNNMNKLKEIRFLFISNSFNLLNKFYKEFDIEKHKNIILGFDIKHEVSRYYNYKSSKVPFLAFYGKNNTLDQSFNGLMGIDQIRVVARI
jgi:thiol-disulfide isomerase/thioredoxin